MLLLLSSSVVAQSAPESIGRVENSSGVALVGALSERGAFPFVAVAVAAPGQAVRDAPLGRFAAMDMREWVLRVTDSVTALLAAPHAGGLRALGGDPVVDLRTYWALGTAVRVGAGGSQEFGLLLIHESHPTASVWLSADEMKRLLVLLAKGSDRSVELSPSFPMLDRYRRILPAP